MAYSKYRPDVRLTPFVESIWVQENPADPGGSRPTTILPAGKPDLVVQFGDPFVRIENGQDTQLAAAHVSGQRSCPTLVRATGTTGLVVVSFRAWGASPFFGSVENMVDSTPGLGDIIGRHRADELVETVQSAADNADRVQAIECFLLNLLSARRPDPRVVEAALRVHRSGGGESIANIATRIGTSRRHLVRLFRSSIGIPPKMYARIARFQKAAAYCRSGHGWSEVAQASGYFDQAHLNNEFARLAGMTPVHFARRVTKCRLGRFFNSHNSLRTYNTIYI